MTSFKGKRVTHLDARFKGKKGKKVQKMATPPSFKKNLLLEYQLVVGAGSQAIFILIV
jgi:hypothetical protein